MSFRFVRHYSKVAVSLYYIRLSKYTLSLTRNNLMHTDARCCE